MAPAGGESMEKEERMEDGMPPGADAEDAKVAPPGSPF
jgi:hypothetical protein